MNTSSLIVWRQTLMKLLRWPSLRMLETPCCLATFWRISRRLSLGSERRRDQNGMGYCYPEQRDTCTELDFRVTCWRRWNRNAATESGARRGTCFKYKQPFPSSDSDRHGDGRKQERRLLPLNLFLTLGLFCLLNSHQNTTVHLTSYQDRFIKEEAISCIYVYRVRIPARSVSSDMTTSSRC